MKRKNIEEDQDSKSEGSLSSHERDLLDENDSSYQLSESTAHSVSELAFEMEIILSQFVPREILFKKTNAITVELQKLYPASSYTSEVDRSSESSKEEIESETETASTSSKISLQKGSDLGIIHQYESIEMEVVGEEQSENQFEQNVQDLRTVVRELNLERFLIFVDNKVLKKKFESLHEEVDVNKTDLRLRRLDVDGRGFKKADPEGEPASAYVKRKLLPRRTKKEATSEQAQEAADKKSVDVYARECMGGFSSSVKGDGYLYVSSDSIVDRPSQVTGSLGREAGDHVIPLALLTRYLEQLVKDREIYDAIAKVRDFAARLSSVNRMSGTDVFQEQNDYQSIIDETRGHQSSSQAIMPRYTRDDDQKAFKFLKKRLIPTVIKRWNNQTRTAFKSIKTQSERGVEGNKVKEVLGIIFLPREDGSTDLPLINPTPQNLSSIISVLDYDPVDRQHPRGNNNFQQLSLVLGDIIEIYQIMGDSNASAAVIFDKFLEDHGWMQYFRDNPQEMGLARGSSPEKEQIKAIIMGELLKHNPDMSSELELSTQIRRSQLEQAGFKVEDVPGDGNCFFYSMERLIGMNHEQLRADAIQEILDNSQRYIEYIPGRDVDGYVLMMSEDREWADHIIIQAMANLLEINIEIHHNNAENNVSVTSIDQCVATIRVQYTGNHYMPILDASEPNYSRRHLVRAEKKSISQKTKPKLRDLLAIGLSEGEMKIILGIDQNIAYPLTLMSSSSDSERTSEGSVTLMPESDHQIDHKKNVSTLLKRLDSGDIKQDSVICLERKEEGRNFGMRDVALLAAIVEYNHNAQQPIKLPNAIRGSMIYQDALLYYKAKIQGVEVVGIEGKGLKANQVSSLYDSARESIMVSRIEQLRASGKDVVFMVGSAHIPGLNKKLSVDVKSSKSRETTQLPKLVSKEILERSAVNVSGRIVQTNYHSSSFGYSKGKAK